jgi:hypothetical protein
MLKAVLDQEKIYIHTIEQQNQIIEELRQDKQALVKRLDEQSVEIGVLHKEISLFQSVNLEQQNFANWLHQRLIAAEAKNEPQTPPPASAPSTPEAPLKRTDAAIGNDLRKQLRAEEELDEERGSERAHKIAKMAIENRTAPPKPVQYRSCIQCEMVRKFEKQRANGGLNIWDCSFCGYRIQFF